MKITLNEINSFKRELCVTVSWDNLENKYNEAFNKYILNYTPKGGRKGKLNPFQKKQFEDQYTASIEASFKEDAMNEFYKKSGGWSKGHLLNLSIGQGETLVTPLQINNLINIICNDGYLYQ